MNNIRTVGGGLAIASTWIIGSNLPFLAAFIGGSVAHANPRLTLDAASDIDCYLVVDGNPPEGKIGKMTVNGVLLDVSWIPWSQLVTAESDAVLASLLHFGLIVADTDNHLTPLKQRIDADFGELEKIAGRLDDMCTRIRRGLSVNSSALPEPEQVMNWIFPATLASHIPLVAACMPLTVRKRFVAAKNVMNPAEYESLLGLYGFAEIPTHQAQLWLDATTRLFSTTTPIAAESHRFWASDVREDSHDIAIGGSQHLIDTGLHREALYWIIATGARCLTVRNDPGVASAPFLPAFLEMAETLQIATPAQRHDRTRRILEWLEHNTQDC